MRAANSTTTSRVVGAFVGLLCLQLVLAVPGSPPARASGAPDARSGSLAAPALIDVLLPVAGAQQPGGPGHESPIPDDEPGQPEAIAVAPDGTVYVTDSDQHVVRRFSAEGGLLARWGGPGTGPGQFATPGAVAVGADGSVVVVDRDNHRVQRFDAEGTLLHVWGGPGSQDGRFDTPSGVAVGADNSVLVADRDSHRVQRFDAQGTLLQVWGEQGGEDGQLDGPCGLAIGPDGAVVVADRWNDRIQRFTVTGEHLGTWGTTGDAPGEFFHPAAVAVAADRSVYVADTYNHRIQRFTETGDFVTTWGTPGEGSGEMYYPEDIAVGPDGEVWVVDWMNARVLRFSADGALIADWGRWQPDDPDGPGAPSGVVGRLVFDTHARPEHAVSRHGALLAQYHYEGAKLTQIVSYPDDRQRFDRESVTIACPGWVGTYEYAGVKLVAIAFSCPTTTDPYFEHHPALRGIGVDADGRVHAAVQEPDDRGVVRLGTDGAVSDGAWATSMDAANAPWSVLDVEVMSDGSRWVLDSFHVDEFNHQGQLFWSGTGFRVRRLDASHGVVAGAQRLRGGTLAGGGGLALAPDGGLLVVLADLPTVLRYDASGDLVDEWGEQGSQPGNLDRPEDLAVDAQGRVYVADTGNDRVQVFDADGTLRGGWGTSGSAEGSFDAPAGIAVDAEGRVYVADTGNDRVQVFDVDGGFLVGWGASGSAPGSFTAPGDIEVDPDGVIVVADTGNHRIQRFTPLGQAVDEEPPDDVPPDEEPPDQTPPDDSVPDDGRLFADVPPDHVHAAGIAAILEAGITTGRVDGTFGPGEGVTRGQMATFLARALDLI